MCPWWPYSVNSSLHVSSQLTSSKQAAVVDFNMRVVFIYFVKLFVYFYTMWSACLFFMSPYIVPWILRPSCLVGRGCKILDSSVLPDGYINLTALWILLFGGSWLFSKPFVWNKVEMHTSDVDLIHLNTFHLCIFTFFFCTEIIIMGCIPLLYDEWTCLIIFVTLLLVLYTLHFDLSSLLSFINYCIFINFLHGLALWWYTYFDYFFYAL